MSRAVNPPAPVLVVDDEPGARGVMAAALSTAGFAVVEAEGGDHALRLLAHEPFAAVVLDHVMAGLDGIEVLQWIRRSPSIALTPVIMVTGRDDTADIVTGLASGADDYVVKPFDPDELVARVQAQVRGRQGWASVVDFEVERRKALTEAARSAGSSGPIEQAAMQLCDGLLSIPGTTGAALAEVVGEGLVALASKGREPFDMLGGSVVSPQVARRLVRRARQGPWLEPTIDTHTSDATSVAVAPVTVDDEMVGLVLATADPDSGRAAFDQLLAVAIDFAAIAAGVFGSTLQASASRDRVRAQFLELAERHGFVTLFQPVVDLHDRSVVGYEALTRFDIDDATEQVFATAARVGAGTAVELRTLEAAIDEAASLPDDAWLALNVSPTLVLRGHELQQRLAGARRPTVLELSELEPVADYAELREAVTRLGSRVQLSVDDAGSGFAGLGHILALRADFVKVDRSWIAGIDADPARRALVAGIQNFADETGAAVIAEGIETVEELDTVRRLGIRFGQGFLLGPPTSA